MTNKHLFWLMAIVFLWVNALNAQVNQPQMVEKVEAKPGEASISYEKYVFPNGLRLYVHEDKSDPLVHVEVTYHVGSNREHLGITGFAHFFEHMMFQGSKHVADEEHIKIIESCGGIMNGTTNQDRTNYFETVPSNMLETALWLEADRMGWLIPAVTQEKFEIQRSAVKNEKDQNVVNAPYVRAITEVNNALLYPKGHPYSWPIIGYVEDLDRVGVQDLKNFFMRWYGPNNAIIVVSGDVNTKEVVALVDKYFGVIPKGQEVRKMRAQAVTLDQDVFQSVEDNIYAPLTMMTFPTIQNYHRDEPALDILAELLGGSKASPFQKRLVKSGFALQTDVSHPCTELAGEFKLIAVTDPKKGQQQVLDSIRAILNSFDVNAISDEDIKRVKAKYEASLINVLESASGKATQLVNWEMLLGDKKWNLNDEIERYRVITKADIQRVFNKYIKNKSAAVVYVYPKNPADKTKLSSINPYLGEHDKESEKQYAGLTYTEPLIAFDKSVRPTPTAAKAPVIPTFSTKTFDNGLQVIHTKTDELPKITMFFEIDGGKIFDAVNPKKLGVAALTAQLMTEGTLKRSAEEIEKDLDALGSTINFSSGGLNTSIYVTSLTKNINATLAILEEILFEPLFSPEELKTAKEQLENSLYQERTDRGSLFSRSLNAIAHPNHILGASGSGYLSTINKISSEDLRSYYNSFYAPNLTRLTIVGNIDEATIISKLKFLENWKRKDIKLPELPPIQTKTKRNVYLIDVPGATQSLIGLTKPSFTYDPLGDFYKIVVANYPLGGSFNSRINLNLREAKGFTYGARSGISGTKYAGNWQFTASVKVNATDSALAETIKEITKFNKEGITAQELDETKKSINQSQALRFETTNEKASFLSQMIRFNLSPDYLKQQQILLNALTVEELNNIIKKQLNPDDMDILIVGDANDIKKKIAALKLGAIQSFDHEKIKVPVLKY